MALRIGQPQAASHPAVLDTDEEGLINEQAAPAVEDEPLVEESGSMEGGSVIEWLQEALDIGKQAGCPEELLYALEQALVHLIGPAAVGATEPVESVEAAPVAEAEVEE